ncbi:phage major capsid protein [uncultured Phascolarctobacterium sp.]|uniref:phage major capsid protein n=1 Tax=uncultured Phascolarctobacterium sp. TaxID=512296 RepID=UPI0015B0729F|nr:phage major capsid protein [uncultured Phascolarctobacterium sp.]
MNYNESKIHTSSPEYDKHFWNAMRGNDDSYANLAVGRSPETGTHAMPTTSHNKYMTALEKESLFRNIGTTINAYGTGYRIFAKNCDELAQWVSEGDTIPIYDGINDFTTNTVDSWKLAAFVKLDEDFVRDVSFDIENYLINRLAKNFGKAEENAFINGTGNQMPTGILNATGGADVGINTNSLTYDDVVGLYFSVKSEYRKNAVWLMNDKTALALRNLKDSAGNYLWRDRDDTILGKKVIISEYMPDVGAGAKPIAFGDFSYYWVIGRKPISVRTLIEKFAVHNQIGYLAFEFLDGKLIRPEAVKVIQINT